MQLVVDKETQKVLWNKKLKELNDEFNKIKNRKDVIAEMEKETMQWDNSFGQKFREFCKDITGKEEGTFIEVMQVLNS
jgi:hypothetical protein